MGCVLCCEYVDRLCYVLCALHIFCAVPCAHFMNFNPFNGNYHLQHCAIIIAFTIFVYIYIYRNVYKMGSNNKIALDLSECLQCRLSCDPNTVICLGVRMRMKTSTCMCVCMPVYDDCMTCNKLAAIATLHHLY